MHKIFCNILLLTLLSNILSGASDVLIPSADMMEMDLPGETFFTFPVRNWRFIREDKPQFADPGFDDSAWAEVEVNKPLNRQKYPRNNKPVGWYRYSFNLPSNLNVTSFEIRPGAISAGDQIYINGVKCAEYAFRETVNGSSTRPRYYQLAGKGHLLKPGRNVIAVRVKLGYLHGMHSGIPELRKLADNCVFGSLAHKSPGESAVVRHITGSAGVNIFTPDEPLLLRPQLSVLTGAKYLDGTFEFTISRKNGKVIRHDKLPLRLFPGFWRIISPVAIANPGRGDYNIAASYTVPGNTVPFWQCRSSFTVRDFRPFTMAADSALTSMAAKPLPLTVNEASFSNFGPRSVSSDGMLFDNYALADTLSAGSTLLVLNPVLQAPLFMLSNVKPMPGKWHFSQASHSIGSQHDSLENAWSLGMIQLPSVQNKAGSPTTAATTWNGKTIRYGNPDGPGFDLGISNLSPAWSIKMNNCDRLRLFAQPAAFKLGAPGKMFVAADNKLSAVSALTNFPENWLLLTFAGQEGWEEFDCPLLVVFEKKPSRAELGANGLELTFPAGDSGVIRCMALYGVTLQKPSQVGVKELELCRYWSRTLPALPHGVKRTVKLDYTGNRMLVRDEYIRHNPTDEWGNVFRKISPVPPMFMLAAAAGMDIRASHRIIDCNYAMLSGPMAAAEDCDAIVYSFNGITHYVNEVREVGAPETPAVKKLAGQIQKQAELILPELKIHPWRSLTDDPKGKPELGGLEPDISNLLLALPYLNSETARQILSELAKEFKASFLRDDLPVKNKKGKIIPINMQVFNPLSGKRMTALGRHARDNGIDCPCWEALRLYLYWDVARHCNIWSVVRENWQQIKYSGNILVNANDWAYAVSWDSYGGIRVGNGFQENTIFHAGMIAYSRMARQLGHIDESDRAAYYALMQLPGLRSCAAAGTMDYLRRVRPWLYANSGSSDIEYLERKRPHHHVELNDRSGLWHRIIFPRSAFYSHGFIMTRLPEIMRPFKEEFGDFTTAHLNYDLGRGVTYSHQEPPPVDHFVYLSDRTPFSAGELLKMRLKIRKKITPFDRISDLRGAIDALSTITYRKLW